MKNRGPLKDTDPIEHSRYPENPKTKSDHVLRLQNAMRARHNVRLAADSLEPVTRERLKDVWEGIEREGLFPKDYPHKLEVGDIHDLVFDALVHGHSAVHSALKKSFVPSSVQFKAHVAKHSVTRKK